MKELNDFCALIRQVIDGIDSAMDEPSTHERGRKIAKLQNRLEVGLDIFERYHKPHYKKFREPSRKARGPKVPAANELRSQG